MQISLSLSIAAQLRLGTSIYGIDALDPALVLDFDDEYYRANSAVSTFSDSITHSRAGNATMVDSDGLLKWAPHNLLTYSEQFDNAAWVKINGSVTANQTVGPDGTLSGDNFSASGSFGILRQVVTVTPGITYTFSFWAKNVDATAAFYRAYDQISASDIVSATSYFSQISTDTWTRVLFSFTVPAGCTSAAVYVASGDQGGTVSFWGAHLYRSDLGGMVNNPDRGDSYVPTTSSAVYLPRRGHHVYNGSAWVNEGLLHESEARTNLIAYSDFSSGWSTSSLTANSVSTGVVNIVPLATTTIHAYYQNAYTVTANDNVTFAVDVLKASTYGFVALSLHNGTTSGGNETIQVFNLSTGAIANSYNTAPDSYTIEDRVDYWRISITFRITTTAANVAIWPLDSDRNPRTVWLANGTSGVTIRYPQVEAGSTPSSYIPTSGATVTRAAETLTVPAANLPWPEPVVIGDELVTNGTFDSDLTGWTSGGSEGASASVVGAAARLLGNSYIYKTISGLTAGQPYVLTADITGTNSQGSLRIGTSPNVGDVYDSPTQNSATTLTRTFVPIGSAVVVTLKAEGTPEDTSAYMDFDNISVREINPLSVSIQMDGRMTYADDTSTTQASLFRWLNSTTGDYIINRIDTSVGTDTGRFYTIQYDAPTTDLVGTAANYFSPDVLVPFNIASRHGSTFINGAVDGVALTANTTPVALPDLSATDLQLGYDFMGTIRTFRMWADDLGDTGIAEATLPSLEPSLSLTFDGSENSFTVSDWSA
jgi:hypothetical protein